jgi:hypothetical protein
VSAAVRIAAAILASSSSAGAVAAASPAHPSPIGIIWDDDCGSDLDCIYSLDAIHRQASLGRVSLLALVLDSPNPYGAPVMRAWGELWRQPRIPIGVYRGATGRAGAASGWSRAVRDVFRPGDTSDRYPDCVSVYRQALARAPDRGVRIVETGFPTCLAALMRSRGDATDTRTGAQLIRAKVAALFVMGGDYPGPATEYNFHTAAADAAYLFRHWTARAGYPPVYLNGFTPGSRITLGAPGDTPARAAIDAAQAAAGETARPAWDLLSLHQAIAGTAGDRVSVPGRNRVSALSGRNRWRAGAGGHRWLAIEHAVDQHAQLAEFVNGSGSPTVAIDCREHH